MENNYLYLQGSTLQLKDSLDLFARGLLTTEELQSELVKKTKYINDLFDNKNN